MSIAPWSCFQYHTLLHDAGESAWRGTARADNSDSLLGSRPSVIVNSGRVTLTRGSGDNLGRSVVSTATFDAGEALATVLRDGDKLSCWHGGTAEIGLSVTRAGSLVLGLGTLGRTPGAGITVDVDPRVEEAELASEIRYIDRPGTHIVWLDPQRPRELRARLRELDGDFRGVNILAIVVRSDDEAVRLELNRRTMGRRYPHLGAMVFLEAPERFARADEWLEYCRTLSPERPPDLWLRIRSGSEEALVPQGTSAVIDSWLAHVLRVYEPGEPGRLSKLGLARTDIGVTPAILERSTAAVASGLVIP